MAQQWWPMVPLCCVNRSFGAHPQTYLWWLSKSWEAEGCNPVAKTRCTRHGMTKHVDEEQQKAMACGNRRCWKNLKKIRHGYEMIWRSWMISLWKLLSTYVPLASIAYPPTTLWNHCSLLKDPVGPMPAIHHGHGAHGAHSAHAAPGAGYIPGHPPLLEVGCLSFCGETDFPIRWKWCYITYNHISCPMFQTPWKLL